MNYKCVVCLEKNEIFPYNPLIQGSIMRICSQECYHIFCAEYALADLDVKIDGMKERLEAYRMKREVGNQDGK